VRECGECTLCCTLLGIKELKKPPLRTCQHVVPRCGCSIYATRPAVCRGFECVWLTSTIAPEVMRPDKIHGFMVPTKDGNVIVHEDPAYPGMALAALKPLLDRWLAAHPANYYVVLTGQRRMRTFFGDPLLLADALAFLDEVDGEIG
jgi:hypothetical protein